MAAYTIVKERYIPKKTLRKPLNAFLGLGLVGVALYYFGTQFNSERIYEWLPLAGAAILGLFLLLGYAKSWPVPGSKEHRGKLEYVITENKLELQIYYSSLNKDREMIKEMSLTGVKAIEIVEERKNISGSYQITKTDVAGTSPIGSSQPSGTYVATENYNYTQVKKTLVLKPTNQQFEIPYNLISTIGVAEELNRTLYPERTGSPHCGI